LPFFPTSPLSEWAHSSSEFDRAKWKSISPWFSYKIFSLFAGLFPTMLLSLNIDLSALLWLLGLDFLFPFKFIYFWKSEKIVTTHSFDQLWGTFPEEPL
jgi:hypothetical protein